MTPGLTGRTRCRVHRTFWGWPLLVLQVEVSNLDHDFSPYPAYWRDATVEDLTVINTPTLHQPPVRGGRRDLPDPSV